MKKDFDILEYPFKVEEMNLPSFVKTKLGYEVRICDNLDSKKIIATKNKKHQKYFHMEISDGKCKLIGYTENLYAFTTPADFYLPVPPESRKFYEDIYNKLVYGDMNQCLELAEMFDKTYKNSELPMYPVPITSTVESFENYNLKDFKGAKEDIGDTIHVGYEDEIPISPLPGLIQKLEKLYGMEILDIQRKFFDNVFSTHPILRISNIIKIFKSGEKAIDINLSNWKIKKLLPLYAYFVTSGPWRGCWIKFGFNPKRDSNNFRYQIYDSRKSGRTFQVFEAEDIIQEVERNKSWYLTNKPNFKTGFHTQALINLLKFRSELDIHVDSDDESNLEFEVFD